MRLPSKLLALTLVAAMQPAVAGVITLDFEDATNDELGNRYYAQHKVEFSSNAFGVIADSNGDPDCKGDFYFKPLAKTGPNCGALLLGTANGDATDELSFTISSDLGFVDGINFSFAVRAGAGARIEVRNAAGGLVTQTSLSPDAACATFCNWLPSSLQFAAAKYIVFYGADQKLMLDDLVLRTASPASLPEPASMALVIGALGAVGWTRKRVIR